MTRGYAVWPFVLAGLMELLALPVCAAKKPTPVAERDGSAPGPSVPILTPKERTKRARSAGREPSGWQGVYR